ncbi:MAG: DeoR/GlpR family DNA-binding transcription regulator [Youngiibacter sp.]|nr:DeoR/GlpR family DNA-binding transcription regulator [Youngiibacter sp.]
MIAAERHEIICREMEKNKYISIGELVRILNSSISTVRRDLIELEAEGKIQRTHGGAVVLGSQFRNEEMTYNSRSERYVEEKERIGQYVAEIVQDAACIVLDTGTTTLAVARNLRPSKLLRVITDSLDIANVLRGRENIDVILIGGVLKTDAGNLYGELALKSLEGLHAEACVVGASGLTYKEGITKHDYDAIPATKKMIEISHQLICVTDSSKVGLTGMVSVASIDMIDILVTDTGMSDGSRKKFIEAGVEVVTV